MIVIKVLVCGSYKSAFQKKLLQRLKKEKVEVFVVNNDSAKEKKTASVFQEYRFPYVSNSIANIMASVSPDVVVFCGAQDEYSGEGERISQSVEFVSGLMNVLTSSVSAKVKRFIYISSEDVFSGSEAEFFDEKTDAVPLTRWEKALAQGEQICMLSDKNEDIETIVVRMPQIYGACQKVATKSICTDFIESFRDESPIKLNANVGHSLLYLDDAIEAVFRVINEKSEALEKVYHVAPKKVVAEKEIYDILSKITKSTPKLLNESQFVDESCIKQSFLSTTQEELGFSEKFSLESGLEILYKQSLKIGENTEEEKKNVDEHKILFLPVVETIVAFFLVQAFAFVTRDAGFHNAIDVYLLYTMVVAVVLGALPATIAVILSVIGKYILFFNGGTGIDFITQSEGYLWILQLFALSILAGYIRDRYNRVTAEIESENVYLKEELECIKSINDSNVQVKEVFENRLENYKDSYVKVYEIVSQLDDLEAKAIMFKAASVVSDIMKSEDVAIYTYEERSGFCRLMASTSELAKKKGKSIQLGDYPKVLECLKEKKVYMNRELEENAPMYAIGTYTGEKLEVVTIVWDTDLVNINLHQSNLLSMLGKLMERSMSRALRYMESIKATTYVEDTSVMEVDAFHQMLDIYCTGESQELLEFTVLEVITTVKENPELYEVLKSITRDTDYIGLDRNGKLYVLLTNSGMKDVDAVIARFENRNIDVVEVEKKNGKTAETVFSNIAF